MTKWNPRDHIRNGNITIIVPIVGVVIVVAFIAALGTP